MQSLDLRIKSFCGLKTEGLVWIDDELNETFRAVFTPQPNITQSFVSREFLQVSGIEVSVMEAWLCPISRRSDHFDPFVSCLEEIQKA